MKVSAHFDEEEFRSPHCGAPVVQARLVWHLERLRAIVGRPLRIVSGYRCQEANRRAGGAKNSRHLYGDAADIPSGYATVQQAEQAGFVGIGSKGRWAIHVDMRPGGPARWKY